MKEMQNGMKHLQMDKLLMVLVLMAIKVSSQESVLNLVQMVIGVQFLVLVMVFLSFFLFFFFFAQNSKTINE